MKIISEYTLTKDEIKKYRNKGYEIYYGNESFKINQGESVGFLLDFFGLGERKSFRSPIFFRFPNYIFLCMLAHLRASIFWNMTMQAKKILQQNQPTNRYY